jgi:hypothetical protein
MRNAATPIAITSTSTRMILFIDISAPLKYSNETGSKVEKPKLPAPFRECG